MYVSNHKWKEIFPSSDDPLAYGITKELALEEKRARLPRYDATRCYGLPTENLVSTKRIFDETCIGHSDENKGSWRDMLAALVWYYMLFFLIISNLFYYSPLVFCFAEIELRVG